MYIVVSRSARNPSSLFDETLHRRQSSSAVCWKEDNSITRVYCCHGKKGPLPVPCFALPCRVVSSPSIRRRLQMCQSYILYTCRLKKSILHCRRRFSTILSLGEVEWGRCLDDCQHEKAIHWILILNLLLNCRRFRALYFNRLYSSRRQPFLRFFYSIATSTQPNRQVPSNNVIIDSISVEW